MDARPKNGRPRLPFLLLLFGFILFSVNGWLRVAGSIVQWDWLVAAKVHPGPLYLALSGAVWGLAGLAALVWVARRLPRYRLTGQVMAVVIAVTYWVDRLFFRNPEASLPNTAFSIVFTLCAVAFAWAVLYPGKEGLPTGRPRG